ncbi:MAG: cation:proton antiporter [Treponema sp.]|nr:cation:proton antiporter [Treponema sp.]
MEQSSTQAITILVFQLALIIFAVRIFGRLAAKIGIPSVLGELLAGVVIGPYALGSVGFLGFPNGLFPLQSGSMAVSPELYAIGQIASVVLLFASGLETDLSLFIRYSLSGGIIGLGGVIFSFVLGDVLSMFMLGTSFMDVRCLFLGIMSTATSVGITARILSDKKKMDSPEGVTILAAAVFDDVLGIVLLAVVMGIVTALGGGGQLSGGAVALIALKAFGIWLVVTVLCIALSKEIARFVRLFGGTIDFSIAAFGFALFLAGLFEKQGLAMIIGSYTAGLALSRTDIAPVVQERIRPLYKFFVPVFFAVMGMSVDVTQLLHADVLLFGALYTLVAVAAKLLGCGGPALTLGFNMKGALRIGAGMVPRGEVALIVAGIGLSAGIIDQKLFGVVILMTLVTTLLAPPLLSLSLKVKGSGTRTPVEGLETESMEYDFGMPDVAYMALQLLVHDLLRKGFYVQMRNVTDGMFQARKKIISLSAHTDGGLLLIQAPASSVLFVRELVYDMLEQFYGAFQMENRAAKQDG